LTRIFYDNIKFRLRGSRKFLKNIERVIRNEKKVLGDLNFILCGDKELLEINREYLKHDYLTDVIAFGYSQGRLINGEIYISVDSVKNNAHNYKVSLKDEVLRVMIHGTLHLCGYEDMKNEDRKRMRRIEDKWLKIFKNDVGI